MSIELPEFAQKATAWLEDHCARRAPDRDVVWGEGSDDVSLFKNLGADEERAHVDELRAWQQTKSDAGYGSIAWPVEYGGAGLPRDYEVEFGRLERGFRTPPGHEAVSITLELVAPTILTIGSAEQKDRFIRAMRRCDDMWCQLFSEPGAGSDLASIATRARPDGDQWVLNGQKVWTSGAQFAAFGYIVCRTGEEGSRHAGLTAFAIPMDSPGVEVRPLRQMSGGASFNEVFLTDVRIPDGLRLGAVGDGWRVAMTTLGFERAAATQGGPSSDELFGRLVQTARKSGRNTDPLVRQELVDAYVRGRVRTLTRRRAGDALRAHGVPGPEGSLDKLAWTLGLQQFAHLAGTLVGPGLVADSGQWGTFAWSEFVNGAAGYRIAGGSDEIQRNIIAERVLGLPKG